jgi:hypothetical protein
MKFIGVLGVELFQYRFYSILNYSFLNYGSQNLIHGFKTVLYIGLINSFLPL